MQAPLFTLHDLGWDDGFAAAFEALEDDELVPARVAAQHRGGYDVLTEGGERRVRLTGRLRHEAASAAELPAVGDWVALRDETVHAVLPRRSAFSRKAAWAPTEEQVLAANLDAIFIVSALDGDLNLRRLERYLTLAWESGATPVLVLTKADLCEDVAAVVEQVREDALGVEVLAVSSVTGAGLDAVRALLLPGRTGAMVGPSGVGKSSLVNALSGRAVADTAVVRESDGRGRHTTTARELHLLPGGGLLIDNPGMRELSLYDDANGVDTAYADVAQLAAECRFRDCAHRTEPGCAVAAAIDDGRLDPARYSAWRKLQAEAHRQLLRVDARARAAEKARMRSFHRAVRDQPNRQR